MAENLILFHCMWRKEAIPQDFKNVSIIHTMAVLLWWFLLFYVLVFNFLCCWRFMYVIIF